MIVADAHAPIEYWFGDTRAADNPDAWADVAKRNNERWFIHGKRLDAEIEAQFAATVNAARRGELDHWQATAHGTLALILCLDQFPRHIYRGHGEAFASDEQAQAVCRRGIDACFDQALTSVEQSFFYLPLEHAESRWVQALSVAMFGHAVTHAPPTLKAYMTEALGYAQQHKDIVDRFGRFPHRNESLGRTSSDDEIAFLSGGGARFGQ